jgi:hypothetical protein
LRLGAGDIRRIKALADRLGARDSDVVRFAIKLMMSRMLPLCDPAVKGRRLLPVFAEWGPEAVRHFELDADTLNKIINGNTLPDEQVDEEDINLLTMVGSQDSYAKISLRALTQPVRPPASGERRDDSPAGVLRRHLYKKYGLTGQEAETPAASSPVSVTQIKQVR